MRRRSTKAAAIADIERAIKQAMRAVDDATIDIDTLSKTVRRRTPAYSGLENAWTHLDNAIESMSRAEKALAKARVGWAASIRE